MLKTDSFQFCPHFKLCTMESSKACSTLFVRFLQREYFWLWLEKKLPVLLKIDNYVHFWPQLKQASRPSGCLKSNYGQKVTFKEHFLNTIWNPMHWYSDKKFGGEGGNQKEKILGLSVCRSNLSALLRKLFSILVETSLPSVRKRDSNVKKVSPVLRRATSKTRPFHFASDMCFLPLCHHDSASWHAERSSRWKQCRAVLGWCDLPWLFCTYLIYCTSYFLFPRLSAARHVVLPSASAWPRIWEREQGCPGVWARRTVCSVPLGLGSLRAPRLMHYNISCYLMSYSLCFFFPDSLVTITQSSREELKLFLMP